MSAIIPSQDFAPTAPVDLLDWTISMGTDYQLTNGWISGHNSRFTVTSPKSEFTPCKGDPVRHGLSVINNWSDDQLISMQSYFERLVCTNGATRQDKYGCVKLRNNSNLEVHQVQRGLVDVTGGMGQLVNAWHRAAGALLLPPQVRAVREWVRDSDNGGSNKLDTAVVARAVEEARTEGRGADEVSLYNFINAINWQAHEQVGIRGRVRIESMAMNALQTFIPAFKLN